jgi:sphingomyelin phosphodiesterase
MDKVRVVAVNTEACYNANFFLMKLRDDPGDQLKWLEQTLYEMEANGEVGILLGHVPPGSNSCLEQWATRYQALMDRFQNVIRFQIFGHVHKE